MKMDPDIIDGCQIFYHSPEAPIRARAVSKMDPGASSCITPMVTEGIKRGYEIQYDVHV
jgi:hypothetical protein